jgi:hypothetical protein
VSYLGRSQSITLRKNEAGNGYYDIWYRGVHSRLYTGIPLTPENTPWFEARKTLLLEMIEQETFEVERARAVIGVVPQRQKRTERKADITVEEFGQEWLEHKKTSISVDKVYEYGNILDLICATTIALPGKKKTHIVVGSLQIREFRAQYVDLLVNTLRECKGIKGQTMSNTRLNDILLRVVRPLLDLAHQREYLDKNPHEWV